MTTATRAQHCAAALLAAVFGVIYAAVTLIRFDRFAIASYDNAIFEQAVKSYAGLGAPIVDIKAPGYNILGDHFSPVTALIAPFYRVFPSAQTILLAQVVLIAVSIYVIAWLAMRYMGTVFGIGIGVAYGLSFGIQSAVEADFHEVAFAAPLLALAGAAYVDRRYVHVMWWSVLLLFVKEDMGITVAAIGFVLWLAGDRRRGLTLALIGVVGAILVVGVIIPAFNPDGVYPYAHQGERGRLEALFDQVDLKAMTTLITLAITGFAALWSPWVLVGAPMLLGRFVNDIPFYWGTGWHYSLLLMPIVFVAMIDGYRRWPKLVWTAPIGALAGSLMLVNSPVSALFEADTYKDPPRADSARMAISLVPDGASVETDIGLLGHLVTHHDAYWLGSIGDVKPDYVVFDTAAGLGSPDDVVSYAEQKHGGTYYLLYDNDGYKLAQRQPQ